MSLSFFLSSLILANAIKPDLNISSIGITIIAFWFFIYDISKLGAK